MSGKRYSKKDVLMWAEEYKVCGSIKEVAKKFDAGKCTVSKRLHECKEEFGLIFPFEDDEQLFAEGKMRCSGECGQIKLLTEFYYDKKNDRYAHDCIECKKKHQMEYHKTHLEEDCARSIKWAQENREASNKIKSDWKKNNPEKQKECNRKSNARRAPIVKIWREENRERLNENMRERRKTDINFKITCYLRSRISTAVRKEQKAGSAINDLGCSIEVLRQCLESKFYTNPRTEEQMSWDNYGTRWHIDHIIPLVTLDLVEENQFCRACHYTNLQPLWVEDNLSKSDSLSWDWE